MSSCVLGVDVGGTYTDAVILRERQVVSSCKCTTTVNRTNGIVDAIKGALDKREGECRSSDISRVCIGTTHFVNAVVERSTDKLSKVAVIRLCGPASKAIPPFSNFPPQLKSLVQASVHMVSGGLEYNGVPISPLCNEELEKLANTLLSQSNTNIVISGVFSPNSRPGENQEECVAKIFQSVSKKFSITLASKIGKLGIIERENAAILNESLKVFAKRTVNEFKTALDSLKLSCPFYLTGNDGTLISVDEAMEYPIFTFSSGPTNSMRGAMFLSGKEDGIVVDIGGTTTDVGVLVKGFPREASSQVKIGGVSTNFRMPNVISIGLGGGSIVTVNHDKEKKVKVQIGPSSVGSMLSSKGLTFGGDICTATDIAVGAGITNNVLPLDKRDAILSKYGSIIYTAMKNIQQKVEEAIDLVKTTVGDTSVLLVGGGSILVDKDISLKGASNFIIPPHFEVANAVGAALGAVSGQSESIESIADIMSTLRERKEGDVSKEDLKEEAHTLIVDRAVQKAINNARLKGCVPGTEYIHEKSIMNVSYVPDTLSVSVKVIGQLDDQSTVMKENNQSDTALPSLSEEKNDSIALYWPYKSQQEITLDKEAMLPAPLIDQTTGEWIVSQLDVECITIGAGILGCGGGGSPHIGYLTAIQSLQEGKEIRIVNPTKVKQEDFGLVAIAAFMGAPLILIEKLQSGNETTYCLEVMQRMLASGLCTEEYDFGRQEKNDIKLSKKTVGDGQESWFVDPSTLPEANIGDTNIPLDKRITGLISVEMGGANSIEPLVVGARLNLPVLDADGMGRAFPELQMYVPFIRGLVPYPSCVANEKGDKVAVSHVSTPNELENIFRNECVRMGMTCGICVPPMTLRQVLDWCILHSYSKAWRLGRCVKRAVQGHSNVSQAIVEQENGLLLITGKIVDILRQTESGFTSSVFKIKGTGSFSPFTVQINAKNENLIARQIDTTDNSNDTSGKVLAVTPDLITLVDSDTGYPITTEDVKYGLRVSVLVLPADSKLLTEEALAIVGPKGFGMTDVNYSKPLPLL